MSLDRDRLAKILAMLSSNHDGERLAAVNRAASMLQAAGVRWEELVKAPPEASEASAAQVTDLRQQLDMMIALLKRRDDLAQEARTKNSQYAKEVNALKRSNADLKARLDIAQAENAKLRQALGPDKAARAVFGDLAATVFGDVQGQA